MEEKKSIDQLIMEAGDLLKIIQEKREHMELNPEILKKVEGFKKVAQWIKEKNERIFNQSEINIDALTEKTLLSEKIEEKTKQSIKQSKQIQEDGKKILGETSKKIKEKTNEEEMSSAHQKKKERRKLFKSLGGNSKWIPL